MHAFKHTKIGTVQVYKYKNIRMKNFFRYQKISPYMNSNVTNVTNVKRSLKPLPNFLGKGQ